MNVLEEKDIEKVSYSNIGGEWSCTIRVFGRNFNGVDGSKDGAYTSAFLNAEEKLFPPQSDTVVI